MANSSPLPSFQPAFEKALSEAVMLEAHAQAADLADEHAREALHDG
ncbi:hypothetical protein BH24CHL6_BH24CHL6_12860 [soil metagenome]